MDKMFRKLVYLRRPTGRADPRFKNLVFGFKNLVRQSRDLVAGFRNLVARFRNLVLQPPSLCRRWPFLPLNL